MSMRWLMANSSLHKRTFRSIALIFMVMLLVFTAGCSLLPDEKVEEELPTITPPKLSQKPEYIVKTDTLETKVRGIGKLMSLNEEELFFVSDNMRIKDIYVKVGDYVNEGQLIAELDVNDLENQLRTQRYTLRSEELHMIEMLRKADEISAEELEQAVIAFELKRTKLVEIEKEIGKSKILAPFSGNIVSLAMSKGDTSRAYEAVAAVSDLTRLTVATNIGTEDRKKIAVGMEVIVDINAAGTHTGKIERMPVEKAEPQYDPWNPDRSRRMLLTTMSSFS